MENAREITRAMRPEIVNRLRDDNVLITQDVQHADKIALQRAARGGTHPTYIVMTRTLPHPYKSPFTLARDISLQLDTASNAIVIVATEADGYLGVYSPDIEYSMLQKIASRSALSWTNEGYAIGAAQTLRLVAAQRDKTRAELIRRLAGIAASCLVLLCAALFGGRKLLRKSNRVALINENNTLHD